ncbi:NAD(P)/FAD-dependent oxidoreductase [Amycolatopsis oliviviridis]|uniref:Kynurenine 3-monooxygenase n=1 Tax=Amycolatopsis oliviviridis TaxID=1471590 RepID=A0ABQ3MER9_9PSEU|nr:NAD(P)/FAD-dependent oxidoreductase [Amycolatopsis oliviviridis]GHH38758.1 kynurenine 3-monooxygenase [Amycolatopsis oliviviridis]
MEFTIVGAGMAGAFLALSLGRQGHVVTVYDRRPDPRETAGAVTSMNLGLSRRGLAALDKLGLSEEVRRLVVPMRGRMLHNTDGGLRFSAYGEGGILAIQRQDLSALLVDAASRELTVRFVFDTRCTGVDRDLPSVSFVDPDGRALVVKPDVVVGADGAFSVVRRALHHDQRAEFSQSYLDWGWRELHIPAAGGGAHRMTDDVFHLWPRGDIMMFAHPNRDGSFTCSCVLPFHGTHGFDSLRTAADVESLFRAHFPDVLSLVPDLGEEFLRRPTFNLVTVSTAPWIHEGKVALIGDACHAVYPFLAQGMNSAFEDALELTDSLAEHPANAAAALTRYYTRRKPNTDALATMSHRNFAELRDTVRSPSVRLERAADSVLEKVLRHRWMPLHAMVTNTTVPYAKALQRATRQHRILKYSGAVAAAATAAAVVRLLRR